MLKCHIFRKKSKLKEELFAVKASDHLEVLKKQVGSTVKLEYVTETDGTCTVTSLQ